MAEVVHVRKDNGLAIVTIDNPPMNVLSRSVASELLQVYRALEHDRDVTAIVLTGKGDRAFMAGANIKEFPDALGKPGVALEMAQGFHELMNTIDFFPKPTIAALNGFTLGGGLELALACDLRVCDKRAKLGFPEINLGIFPGAGGTQRLPRLIGEAKAKELMFTGQPITAEEAHRSGLVNALAEPGQTLETAIELARQIASRSLPALAKIKQAIAEGIHLPLTEAVQVEARLFDEVFQTKDSREGVEAFIEKREPHFHNE